MPSPAVQLLPMFHYRWHYADDIDRAGEILPRWRDITAPVIEGSYQRFLAAFDAHLRSFPFLMGNRPGASDFGIYGQLTQLSHFDPTPWRWRSPPSGSGTIRRHDASTVQPVARARRRSASAVVIFRTARMLGMPGWLLVEVGKYSI